MNGDSATGRGLRHNLPFLNGVYIAVNAISDAHLVVDGPFCVFYRTEMQGAHDLAGSLASPVGRGRVVQTDVRLESIPAWNVAIDRGAEIEEILLTAAEPAEVGLVLVTSMDFHTILSTPLERYCRLAQRRSRAPIVYVPPRSLDGDWLHGYASTLAALATSLELGVPEPAPERVAVVGHLMDRLEGDQRGNVAEIRRLLERLGLEVCSFWLDGGDVEALRAVRRAGLVVSLPYAREAARILAARLGLPLVPADLPLGLGASGRFLREVGRAAGRAERAEQIVEEELASLVPAIRAQVFRFLGGRRLAVRSDPHLALGLAELAEELGLALAGLAVSADPALLPEETRARLEALGAAFQPRQESVTEALPGGGGAPDLLVADTLLPLAPGEAAWLPFGYPNYLRHPLGPEPFLGYAGVRWWVARLSEALLQTGLRQEAARPRGTLMPSH